MWLLITIVVNVALGTPIYFSLPDHPSSFLA
jgi:hypothetical protein